MQRLRRADGLRVPPTRRRLIRRGVSTGLPTKATRRGHVWTWDFVSDATVRGGALKMLTILDEHTRECHVLRPDRAMRASDVLAWLERAIKAHGKLSYQSPARFAAQLPPFTPASFMDAGQTTTEKLQTNQLQDQLSTWLKKAGPVIS